MGLTQQALGNAAAKQPTTQAWSRLPHQHQAGAALAGVLNQGPGDLGGAQQHHFAAQPLGQLLGALQARPRLFVEGTTVVDMHQAPRQVTTLRHPAGMAHQPLGMHVAINAHQQAPAHCRRRLTELPITLRQVVVDLRGGGLHRQFTQGGEIGLGEEGIDCGAGLFRHIHLAVAQTLQQFARRQVDQHQVEGFLQYPVRQRFADLYAGDAAHLIVEAFQMLDVDGGVDVDTGGEQFLHVLPALGVTTARRIAVRQFVHQHQFGFESQQTVEVHLLQRDAAILRADQGLLRQTGKQGFGLGAAMGFHDPGDQPYAMAQLRMRGLQHGVGLAYPGRSAEKDLEPPAPVPGHVGE